MRHTCGFCLQEVDVEAAKTATDVAHLLLAHLKLECPDVPGAIDIVPGRNSMEMLREMAFGAEATASAEMAGAAPLESENWATNAAAHFDRWDLISMGGVLLNTHHERMCRPPCCIHSPSEHHMRTWPQHWSQQVRAVLRECAHGKVHPDPDDLQARTGNLLHPCDGCCLPPGGTGGRVGAETIT